MLARLFIKLVLIPFKIAFLDFSMRYIKEFQLINI